MPELPPWPVIAGLALPRILLSVAVVWFLVPLAVFPGLRLPDREDLIRRGLVGVFLSLALIHLLVVTQIYGTAMFVGVLGLTAELVWTLTLPPGEVTRRIAEWRRHAADRLWRRTAAPPPPPSASGDWLNTLALLGVLALTAWLFFADAFSHPGPAMSDSPVTLAWTKYIDDNNLFRGEVYPRGMYAAVGLLRKLTGLNLVVVLDLTGPLFGFLIVLSCAFFAFKATRSRAAAAIAALVAGPLIRLLPVTASRYVAHNAQEFGMIFVLPAAWYTYQFLVRGGSGNRLAAAAAAGVTVFTHPLAAIFAAISMVATGLTGLWGAGRAAWRRLPALILWVGAAALAGAAPVVLGLLQGQKLHASSVEYMQATFTGGLPGLNPAHAAAAGVTLLLAAGSLYLVRVRSRADTAESPWLPRAAAALVAALGVLFFLLPYVGVPLRFFYDRGGEFAAFGLILAAALLWSLLDAALGPRRTVSGLLTLALVAGSVVWHAPQPLQPGRYYSGQQILQYLRAEAALPPLSWTLITGFTGYALALGTGYHQAPTSFLDMVARLPADHRNWIEEGPKIGLGVTPDYFLVVERRIPYDRDQAAQAREAPRLADAARLQAWIDQNRSRLPMALLFDGDEVAVWRLTLPMPGAG